MNSLDLENLSMMDILDLETMTDTMDLETFAHDGYF